MVKKILIIAFVLFLFIPSSVYAISYTIRVGRGSGRICANSVCTYSETTAYFVEGATVRITQSASSGFSFDHFWASNGNNYYTTSLGPFTAQASGTFVVYFKECNYPETETNPCDYCSGSLYCGSGTETRYCRSNGLWSDWSTCSGGGCSCVVGKCGATNCGTCGLSGGIQSPASSCADETVYSGDEGTCFYYSDEWEKCQNYCSGIGGVAETAVMDQSCAEYQDPWDCVLGFEPCFDCVCTVSKDGEVCGTTTCMEDCCSGTNLYNYPYSTFGVPNSCNRICSGGVCPASCSACTPTLETCKNPECWYCGNGDCDMGCGEDCSSCPEDCGACPFEFSLSLSPSSDSVLKGSSVTTEVSLNLDGGTTQSVALSCSGLPAGASCSFSPTSCNPTCSSTLTISTTTSTPEGSHVISVTGTAGVTVESENYYLTVEGPLTCSDTPDGGLDYLTGSTCTDTTTHQDSCSGDVLTEWRCSGTSCISSTYDCDSDDDFYCSISNPNLVRNHDDWYCSDSNPDFCAFTTSATNTWTCDLSKECTSQTCEGNTYYCFRSNAGIRTWGSSYETKETACSDGSDNDCDDLPDNYDPDCGATCIVRGDCPLDGCSLDAYIVYSCTGGSCVSESDDCSDCSCDCGHYNEEESLESFNCDDDKDNDCDGFEDEDDPDCFIAPSQSLEDIEITIDTYSSEEKLVSLSYSISPDLGTIDVVLQPTAVIPPATAKMKIDVKPGTPDGIYVISIRGTGGGFTTYAHYNLIIGQEETPECAGTLTTTVSGKDTCTVTATLTAADCNGLDWEIKEGSSVKASGTVTADLYSNNPSWTVPVGTFTYKLFIDGEQKSSATTTCSETPPPPAECDSAGDCNDGNTCTIDTCESGNCKHSPNTGAVCGTTTISCSNYCESNKLYVATGSTIWCRRYCSSSGTCLPCTPTCDYSTKLCNYGCTSDGKDCITGVYCQPATAECRTCAWPIGNCGNGKAIFTGGCYKPNTIPSVLKSVTCDCFGILGISKVVSTCTACNFANRETNCNDENNGCESAGYNSGCQLSDCSESPSKCPKY